MKVRLFRKQRDITTFFKFSFKILISLEPEVRPTDSLNSSSYPVVVIPYKDNFNLGKKHYLQI